MAQEINILLVEPGKAPRQARVEGTLDAFEKVVGGPVEAGCYLPQRVLLVCNGEGKSMGFPPNRTNPANSGDTIFGTFLLCGFDDDAYISLTTAQQTEFQACFALHGEADGGDAV